MLLVNTSEWDGGRLYTWNKGADAALHEASFENFGLRSILHCAKWGSVSTLNAHTGAGPAFVRRFAQREGSADWVIVSRNDGSLGYVVADTIAIHLALGDIEKHETPQWCIRITHPS